MNNWILTDSPLFLKHVSLLHQNASLVLKNISNSLLKKAFRKKWVEMYQKVKTMRKDGRKVLQWGDCTVRKAHVNLLSSVAFAAHVLCLRVRQQKGISVVDWIQPRKWLEIKLWEGEGKTAQQADGQQREGRKYMQTKIMKFDLFLWYRNVSGGGFR